MAHGRVGRRRLGAGGAAALGAATLLAGAWTATGATARARRVGHVVWIVMENRSYAQVIGSRDAPYVNALAGRYGLATDMRAITHPSLPNYIAMTSGSTQGVADDAEPSAHRLRARSIFGQTRGDWRSLAESMPSPCDRTTAGSYAARHNPAVYYTRLGPQCRARDVPLGASPDLRARFTFVTPDICHDMHDCSTAAGDAWLRRIVPRMLATREYRSGGTVIFITWDEAEGDPANRVPAIVISPTTRRVRSGIRFTHYSLLRTTEELLGLPLLGAARTAPSMRAAFRLAAP